KFHGPLDRVLTGIAYRSYPRQKPKGEAIGAQHAQVQINDTMDNEARPPLTDANQSFQDNLRTLERAGLALQQLSFHTTADRLHGALTLQDPDRPPVLAAPPEVPPSSALALRLHQSLLERLAQVLLAGKTYTQRQLHDEISNLFQDL